MSTKQQAGPSAADVREAMRRLQRELSHPAMIAAVLAPVGQEGAAAQAVLSGASANSALPRCADCGRPMREVRHENGRCASCY